MGVPSHFSQDLPQRCLKLIDELWPSVENVHVEGQEHLGPLTTTFLLAMANPIIVLPIERIERHRGKEVGGYVNDRPLNEQLATTVDRVLGAARFDACPFFVEGQWRFATVPFEHQNFALFFPDELRETLADPSSLKAAEKLQAAQWASCLRNAISHGGVSYLGADGRANHHGRTELLAFVSATYPKFPKGHFCEGRRDTSQPPIELKVLQISEVDFRIFLKRWVVWLIKSGLSQELARAA